MSRIATYKVTNTPFFFLFLKSTQGKKEDITSGLIEIQPF